MHDRPTWTTDESALRITRISAKKRISNDTLFETIRDWQMTDPHVCTAVEYNLGSVEYHGNPGELSEIEHSRGIERGK